MNDYSRNGHPERVFVFLLNGGWVLGNVRKGIILPCSVRVHFCGRLNPSGQRKEPTMVFPKIRKMLYIRFAVLAVIILLLGTSGIYGLIVANNLFRYVHEESFEKVVAAENVSEEILEMQSLLVDILKNPSKDHIEKESNPITEIDTEIRTAFNTLLKNNTASGSVQKIASDYNMWAIERDSVLGVYASGGIPLEERRRNELVLIKLAELNTQIGGLEKAQYHVSDTVYHGILNTVQRGVATSGILLGICALLSWILFRGINKTITSYEARIRAYEKLLFAAMGTMVEGFILVDGAGTVAAINGEAQTLLGIDEQSFVGKHCNALLDELETLSGVRIRDAVEVGGQSETMWEFPGNLNIEIHKGSTRKIQFKGWPLKKDSDEVFGAIWTLQDISEVFNLRETNIRSEALYKRLFELVSNPLILVEDHTGRVLEVNSAAETVYGYSKEEWLGMKNTDVSAEPEKTRRSGVSMETEVPLRWHRRKSGEMFPIHISVSRFLLGETPVHLILVQDISEQVIHEQMLIDAKEEADAGSLAKSRFISGVSHEIRTPINGIMGALQLLAMEDCSGDTRALLNISLDSCKRLLGVVNAVLDYSKIESDRMNLERTEFSIRKLAQDTVDLFKSQAQMNQITLELDVDPAVEEKMIGDPFRVAQIFNNLVGNAVKFTEQGRIQVTIKNQDAGDHIGVLFTVEDTGTGIAVEKLDSIFESFQQGDETTTRKYGGTGLGLALARKLAEMMGGEITVDSVIGKGSRFSCALRFARVLEAVKPISNEPKVAIGEGLSLKVLIVEDDDANRLLLEKIIRRKNWSVRSAVTSEDAFRTLEMNVFDIILMDIQLPDMDGYDLAKKIRMHVGNGNRYVPIIALTAFGAQEIEKRCIECGIDEFMSKPYDVEELYKMISRRVRGE